MDGKIRYKEPVNKRRIRTSVAAGMYYPDDKKGIIDYFLLHGLDNNQENLKNNKKIGYAQGIIAPHGAWIYSGELVVNAFLASLGRSHQIKNVVIMGPIHDKKEKGLFLSNSHYFNTPLGNIRVNKEFTEKLLFSGNCFEINDIPHLKEHSIEILLPFIKYCFPKASIVPILMGQPRAGLIYDLSVSLKNVFNKYLSETLFVVSCNLSYDNDDEKALNLAKETLNLFTKKDSVSLASSILDDRLTSCGAALVVSLLDSGLLDNTAAHAGKMISVTGCGSEQNNVYYSDVFFE